MEILLRFSGYTMDEVNSMSDILVYRRYFAASEFWTETLGAIFGGLSGGGSAPNMPGAPSSVPSSSPSSPFGDQGGSTSHRFPS